MKIIKNYLLPLLIILLAGFVGLNFPWGKESGTVTPVAETSQNLRLLTFKAPGMFCLGCTSSVEGYVGAIEGVKSVQASLASKKVEVVYDPSLVDKDTILANQIFAAYGKESIKDEPFSGTNQLQTPSTTNLPQSISLKLQQAAAKVSRLENQQDYNELFTQIDQAIAAKNYQQAEELLDSLLLKLQQGEK